MNLFEQFEDFCDKQENLTYKQICDILNMKPKTGTSKMAQIKEWNKIALIEKNGTKYKFIRMRTEQEILDILSEMQNFKRQSFLVSEELENNSGIYKVQYKNIVYIGQTNNFYNRFLRHIHTKTKAYDLILKGGIFEIIECIDDLDARLKKEKIYIQKYCNDKKYICINSNFNYINPKRKKRTFKGRKSKIKVLCKDYSKIIDFLNKENLFYE